MISVVIPTYKEPEVLDLCIRSAIEGQTNNNEIVVVVDGYYDINKSVLDKYKNSISVLNFEENQSLCRATNFGVYNCSNDLVLIVNDDNVFPYGWDKTLESVYIPNSVISPNQIEPIPSIFRQFRIENLGRDPKTFDLSAFWEYASTVSHPTTVEEGSTLPIFMSKRDYLRVGGWDESYPGPWVVDWEFFMKCEMSGMKMLRTYDCHFYHFVSVGTRTPDKIAQNRQIEMECHEYFKYKWGNYAKHNPHNNSKLL